MSTTTLLTNWFFLLFLGPSTHERRKIVELSVGLIQSVRKKASIITIKLCHFNACPNDCLETRGFIQFKQFEVSCDGINIS